MAVLGSFFAFLAARSANVNLELVVLSATVITLLVSIVLERAMPFQKRWNNSHGDIKTDITSASVLIGLIDPFVNYLAPLVVISLYAAFSTERSTSIIPDNAPFVVQLALATLLIEFGRYWAHRLHHTSRHLWWLHAMHHSSERLYTLNNFRFHPLNYLINFIFSIFPLMLMGVSSDVLFGYMAITQPVLMLQHANIDLRNGWLNYVFSTNELHRWHHSASDAEANNNFGNSLILWDIAFRTFKYQSSDNSPEHIGLFSQSSAYPAKSSYLAQLLSVFTRQCCKA
jgi:sterol desaturase/sphingolipid hydroxylase (fatty acid hydroxylase superfamily)